MAAWPRSMPLTRPAALTVATDLCVLSWVAISVTSRTVPSENVASIAQLLLHDAGSARTRPAAG